MFARRETNDPAKVLRLRAAEWSRNEALRITPRRRWDTDPAVKRMVVHRRDIGELALTPMRWGLVPEWSRDTQEPRPLTNIAAEAVGEQIEWRRLLNTHRGVVPTEQFFEWKRVNGVKTREYGFRLRNRRPMMIAALWNRTPGTAESFAYISCEANRLVSLIHDRMPVILDDGDVATWLNPNATLESLLALMQPVSADELELRAVAQPDVRAKPYQPSLFANRAA